MKTCPARDPRCNPHASFVCNIRSSKIAYNRGNISVLFPLLTVKLVMRRRLACKPAHLCYPKGDAAISWHVMASWFWPYVWPHGSQRAAAWIYVNTCVARTCWRWVRKGLYSRSYSARQRSTASKNPEMPSPVAADTPTVCSPRNHHIRLLPGSSSPVVGWWGS